MTHPLHQHGLIPVSSGLLALSPLAFVFVNHHGVDGVGVCIAVAETKRNIRNISLCLETLEVLEVMEVMVLPVGGAFFLLSSLAALALLAALAAL